MKTPEVLFHYTTGNVFRRILHERAIMPDRSEPDNESEVPTVTFSSNTEWERTRFRVGKLPDGKLILMNQTLLKEFDGGLIRIVVPGSIATMDWYAMKDHCGISIGALKGIYDFAISVGARTSQWFSTTERVSEDQWLNVEKMLDDGSWVELPENEIPEPSDEDQPYVSLGEPLKNELVPATEEMAQKILQETV